MPLAAPRCCHAAGVQCIGDGLKRLTPGGLDRPHHRQHVARPAVGERSIFGARGVPRRLGQPRVAELSAAGLGRGERPFSSSKKRRSLTLRAVAMCHSVRIVGVALA
jgi:hypothetical protein